MKPPALVVTVETEVPCLSVISAHYLQCASEDFPNMLDMFPLTLNCFSACLDIGVAAERFPLELLGGNFASPVSNSAVVLHFSLRH